MKSKCLKCSHHIQTGQKHTCEKCPMKHIWGEIPHDMKFIERCNHFEPKDEEKERLNCLKKIKKLEDEKFILEETVTRRGAVKKQLIINKENERAILIQRLKELS